VANNVYLSIWLAGSSQSRLANFEKLLELFPFSTQQPGIYFARVHAVNFREPVLAEQSYDEGVAPGTVIEWVREIEGSDLCVEVDGMWDLWQYGEGWELKPTPVGFLSKGPDFEDDYDDHIRVELGLDSVYLPKDPLPEVQRKAQSNLKSLLRFVNDVDEALFVMKRRVWTDAPSGTVEVPKWTTLNPDWLER
jgi:hypothetical protein